MAIPIRQHPMFDTPAWVPLPEYTMPGGGAGQPGALPTTQPGLPFPVYTPGPFPTGDFGSTPPVQQGSSGGGFGGVGGLLGGGLTALSALSAVNNLFPGLELGPKIKGLLGFGPETLSSAPELVAPGLGRIGLLGRSSPSMGGGYEAPEDLIAGLGLSPPPTPLPGTPGFQGGPQSDAGRPFRVDTPQSLLGPGPQFPFDAPLGPQFPFDMPPPGPQFPFDMPPSADAKMAPSVDATSRALISRLPRVLPTPDVASLFATSGIPAAQLAGLAPFEASLGLGAAAGAPAAGAAAGAGLAGGGGGGGAAAGLLSAVPFGPLSALAAGVFTGGPLLGKLLGVGTGESAAVREERGRNLGLATMRAAETGEPYPWSQGGFNPTDILSTINRALTDPRGEPLSDAGVKRLQDEFNRWSPPESNAYFDPLERNIYTGAEATRRRGTPAPGLLSGFDINMGM